MAIGFGTISAVSTSQTPTSVAVSGSDTLGIVGVVSMNQASNSITAVTWGGVSMFLIGEVKCPSDRWISVWGVYNPSSSATISFTGGSFWRSYNWYYTGAKQTGQPDAFLTDSSGSGTGYTLSNTSIADNCWTVMFAKDGNGSVTYTAGSNTTMRINTDAAGVFGTDSNAVQTPAGSFSQIVTSGTSITKGGVIFSIAPVTVSAVGRSQAVVII